MNLDHSILTIITFVPLAGAVVLALQLLAEHGDALRPRSPDPELDEPLVERGRTEHAVSRTGREVAGNADDERVYPAYNAGTRRYSNR